MSAIDEACLNFGMPMGACRLLDEVGIDVGVKVAKILHEGLGERAKSSSLSSKLVEEGFYGKKNRKGFYLYDEKGKEEGVNPQIKRLLPSQERKMDETEIQMRLILPMINEASHILDEEIVEKASDVDLGLIFGIGFPPFRGGLLKYADTEGLELIKGSLDRLASNVDGDRYKCSDFLNNLVAQKKKFYDH